MVIDKKKGIIKNKKGIFFTIMVIVILSLFLLSYTLYSSYQERSTLQKRIETMNSFVLSIEEDLERQIYISGFRIIFLLEKEIIETGSYIAGDLNSIFNDTFHQGTILGKTNPDIEAIMTGAKFSDIQNSLNITANKINVKVATNFHDLSISQTNPWSVKFSVSNELIIEDENNLASWNRNKTTNVFIPISNFKDPLYIVNAGGLILNPFTKTPYSDFSNPSNLADHATNSYYYNTTDSPSFLNRIQGDLSADSNGIESMVNTVKLSQAGITAQDKSVVDHIYFSPENPGACHISGTPSWLKLDTPHHTIYQVSC